MKKKQVEVLSDVLSQEIDGEVVLLDLKGEAYFGLDEVGTRIWQLILEVGELSVVYDIMLDEYDVGPEKLKTDLDVLITKLVEAGLVKVSECGN